METLTTKDQSEATRQVAYIEVDLKKLAADLNDIRQRIAADISDQDWTALYHSEQVILNLAKLE